MAKPAEPLKDYPGLKRIKDLMDRHGFKANRKRGQNFIFDKAILEDLVARAGVEFDDPVLEVGSGPGTLTWSLLQAGARVVAVEIDPKIESICRSLFDLEAPEWFHGRVRWIAADFLESKNRINPQVIDAVEGLLDRVPGRKIRVVSNLPYCIATPAVMNLLESRLPWNKIVVTVQEEVAQRFLSPPGTRAYGQVSVLAAGLAEVQRIKRLGAGAFWPKPEVDSSVLVFTPRSERLFSTRDDYQHFKSITREIFAHRRKTWINSLKRERKDDFDDTLEEAIDKAGIARSKRAQDLTLEEIVRLSNTLSLE